MKLYSNFWLQSTLYLTDGSGCLKYPSAIHFPLIEKNGLFYLSHPIRKEKIYLKFFNLKISKDILYLLNIIKTLFRCKIKDLRIL